MVSREMSSNVWSVPSAVAIEIGQSLPSIVRGPAIPSGGGMYQINVFATCA